MANRPFYRGRIVSEFCESRSTLTLAVLDTYSPFDRRYWIFLQRSFDDGGSWADVAALCPSDARNLSLHLQNAARVADAVEPTRAGSPGVRTLPIVTLCGKSFFLDDRLRQLRNVENPMHAFALDDPMR